MSSQSVPSKFFEEFANVHTVNVTCAATALTCQEPVLKRSLSTKHEKGSSVTMQRWSASGRELRACGLDDVAIRSFSSNVMMFMETIEI